MHTLAADSIPLATSVIGTRALSLRMARYLCSVTLSSHSMSGSVKHQAEPMCKASSGTAHRVECSPVTTFSTSSRARLRHASAGPPPAAIAEGRELAGQETVNWAGSTTKPMASTGERRGMSAPGASAKAAPSRVRTLPGAAADAGRTSPLPPGRWWPTVTQHLAPRYAQTRRGPSSVPGIVSPGKITVKGAPAARRLLRNRKPLSSDLARQVPGTYREDGAT